MNVSWSADKRELGERRTLSIRSGKSRIWQSLCGDGVHGATLTQSSQLPSHGE